MSHVSVVNPIFGGTAMVKEPLAPKTSIFNFRSVAKLLAVLGAVAVVGGMGFLAGSSVSGDDDSPAEDADGGPMDAVTAARAALNNALEDPNNMAITANLTTEIVYEVIAKYEQDPLAYDDQYFSAKLVRAFITLKADMDDGRRELSLDVPLLGPDRAPMHLDKNAWAMVRNPDFSNGIVSYNGEDRAEVFIDGSTCYVVAETSEEFSTNSADWWANIQQAPAEIMSILPLSFTKNEAICGCAQWTWWWCSVGNSCSKTVSIGKGSSAFIPAFNSMRVALWSRMVSTGCTSKHAIIFTGYSRGAGIITPMAYAVWRNGLIPANKMRLVTFGSPRVLTAPTSDEMHLKFTQRRLLYRLDPYVHLALLFCSENVSLPFPTNTKQQGTELSRS